MGSRLPCQRSGVGTRWPKYLRLELRQVPRSTAAKWTKRKAEDLRHHSLTRQVSTPDASPTLGPRLLPLGHRDSMGLLFAIIHLNFPYNPFCLSDPCLLN